MWHRKCFFFIGNHLALKDYIKKDPSRSRKVLNCLSIKVTVIMAICRVSFFLSLSFSLFYISVRSKCVLLLTCTDIRVSSVQVFLLDQHRTETIKDGLYTLCEKWQADPEREGPFIKSGVKFQCVTFPLILQIQEVFLSPLQL